MGRKKKDINLFEYLDYRQYLKDFYAASKEKGRGFSLRSFSKKAGFGSSNIFKLVMDGDRKLTAESLTKFMKGLNLNIQEQEFFTHLVRFNQAKNHEQQNLHYQKVIQCRQFKTLKPFEKQQFEFYSTWYHSVVRELITSPQFTGDLNDISDKITPQVSLKQVKQSVELLESLGFIIQKSDKKWELSNNIVSTGSECQNLTMMNYHKSLLDITKNQLEMIPSELRDVSAITIGLKKEFLPELKQKIQEFRQQILKSVSTQVGAEEVVSLTIQLLPLTKCWEENHEN